MLNTDGLRAKFGLDSFDLADAGSASLVTAVNNPSSRGRLEHLDPSTIGSPGGAALLAALLGNKALRTLWCRHDN